MLAYDPDGNPIEVPDDQAGALYLARKIAFRRGDRLPISNGEKFGTVPSEQLHAALTGGWKLDPTGVGSARDQAKYGGLGQQAIAGAEGLASGATLGGSELLEQGAGVDPAGIEGRKRANPVTSGVANVAGAALPMLLAPEAAIPAEIAEGVEGGSAAVSAARSIAGATPAGMVARAGGAIERALGGGAAGTIARGAAETAALGGADEATRQMLEGDDATIPVRAQKILSAAGTSALFGGGVSGVFHLAGALASGVVGKGLDAFATKAGASKLERGTLESAIDAVDTKAEDDPTGLVGKLVDALVGKDRRAAGMRLLDRDTRELARTAESDVNLQTIDTRNAVADLFSTVDNASKRVRDIVKPADIDAGLAGVDPTVPRQRAQQLAQAIRARAEEMAANPADFFSSAKIEQLASQADKLEKNLGEATTKQIWERLDEVKSNLADVSKIGEGISQTERPAARAAGDFRVAAKDLLEDESLFGTAAAAQGRHNELISTWLKAKEPFEEIFGRRVGAKDGVPIYSIDAGKIEAFFKSLGTPGNEAEKAAFVNMVRAAGEISGRLETDPALQEKLASTLGKTEDMAKLARAISDLKKVKGKAAAVEGVIASPIGRMVLGGFAFGPGGAIASAAAPVVGSAVLHLVDQVIARNGEEIRGLARAIAKGSRPATSRAPVAALKVLQSISFTDKVPKPTRDKQEAFRRVAGEIQSLTSNPARARALMQAKVAPLNGDAPKHAAALVEQGMRAIAIAQTLIPPMLPRSPLQGSLNKPVVSDSDIDQFTEGVKVIVNPMTGLEDLAHGRLSITAARTLRKAYPELFGEMQNEILKAIDERGKDVPYRTRQQVGLFFGMPLDPALDPKFIAAMQASFAPPAQQKPVQLRSTKELKSISNAATAMQRLEAKDDDE